MDPFLTDAIGTTPFVPLATMLSPTLKNALALAAVCLTSLMFGLEISSVPSILPTLEQVLHSDFRQIQ